MPEDRYDKVWKFKHILRLPRIQHVARVRGKHGVVSRQVLVLPDQELATLLQIKVRDAYRAHKLQAKLWGMLHHKINCAQLVRWRVRCSLLHQQLNHVRRELELVNIKESRRQQEQILQNGHSAHAITRDVPLAKRMLDERVVEIQPRGRDALVELLLFQKTKKLRHPGFVVSLF